MCIIHDTYLYNYIHIYISGMLYIDTVVESIIRMLQAQLIPYDMLIRIFYCILVFTFFGSLLVFVTLQAQLV